jgi:hypothetical protein
VGLHWTCDHKTDARRSIFEKLTGLLHGLISGEVGASKEVRCLHCANFSEVRFWTKAQHLLETFKWYTGYISVVCTEDMSDTTLHASQLSLRELIVPSAPSFLVCLRLVVATSAVLSGCVDSVSLVLCSVFCVASVVRSLQSPAKEVCKAQTKKIQIQPSFV